MDGGRKKRKVKERNDRGGKMEREKTEKNLSKG